MKKQELLNLINLEKNFIRYKKIINFQYSYNGLNYKKDSWAYLKCAVSMYNRIPIVKDMENLIDKARNDAKDSLAVIKEKIKEIIDKYPKYKYLIKISAKNDISPGFGGHIVIHTKYLFNQDEVIKEDNVSSNLDNFAERDILIFENEIKYFFDGEECEEYTINNELDDILIILSELEKSLDRFNLNDEIDINYVISSLYNNENIKLIKRKD